MYWDGPGSEGEERCFSLTKIGAAVVGEGTVAMIGLGGLFTSLPPPLPPSKFTHGNTGPQFLQWRGDRLLRKRMNRTAAIAATITAPTTPPAMAPVLFDDDEVAVVLVLVLVLDEGVACVTG